MTLDELAVTLDELATNEIETRSTGSRRRSTRLAIGSDSAFLLPLPWDELPALFPEFADAERWLPLLQRHWELLGAAAPRVRVTSVDGETAVRRHYAECLEFWRLVRVSAGAGILADIGSGGGFPGLVIAAVEPEREVHLIEPLKKRAALLEEIRVALGLNNVRVHALRAEEVGRGPMRGTVSLVTARAVSGLAVLLEYGAPLAAAGALLAFPRGSEGRMADETVLGSRAPGLLGCQTDAAVRMRPEVNGNLTLLTFRKTGATPARFPRRPGVPAKHPLKVDE